MDMTRLELTHLCTKAMQVSMDSFYKMGPNVRKIEDVKIELEVKKINLECLEMPRVWTGDPKEKVRIKVDIEAKVHKHIYWLSKKDNVIRQTNSAEDFTFSVMTTENDILTREIPVGFEFDENAMFAEMIVNDIVVDNEIGFKKPKPKKKVKPDVVRDNKLNDTNDLDRRYNNMEIYINFITNIMQTSSNPYL